jgi:CheY-like chemotaxis protein
MSRITVEPIRILLVEDDEADIILTQRALEKANIWNQVDVVRNGQEALDYLRNEHAFADKNKCPRPGLVLLDLNLPGLDGREVLEIMCKDARLKTIPVVIVSTSDYEKDVEFGRSRGVHHYIIKPLQIDNMMATFTTIPNFRIIIGNIAS